MPLPAKQKLTNTFWFGDNGEIAERTTATVFSVRTLQDISKKHGRANLCDRISAMSQTAFDRCQYPKYLTSLNSISLCPKFIRKQRAKQNPVPLKRSTGFISLLIFSRTTLKAQQSRLKMFTTV
jgi:hypothetical protein